MHTYHNPVIVVFLGCILKELGAKEANDNTDWDNIAVVLEEKAASDIGPTKTHICVVIVISYINII